MFGVDVNAENELFFYVYAKQQTSFCLRERNRKLWIGLKCQYGFQTWVCRQQMIARLVRAFVYTSRWNLIWLDPFLMKGRGNNPFSQKSCSLNNRSAIGNKRHAGSRVFFGSEECFQFAFHLLKRQTHFHCLFSSSWFTTFHLTVRPTACALNPLSASLGGALKVIKLQLQNADL